MRRCVESPAKSRLRVAYDGGSTAYREATEVADDERVIRMKQALAGVTRVLSGRRPVTIGAQLAALGGGVDLDRAPDVYGTGIVEDLERRVADLLGKPAAAFFPTGTMAQQVALRIWTEKSGNPTGALHPLHHPEIHEKHAYATLTGLRSVWPTTAPRLATADEIRAYPEPFAAIQIELPLREAGFVLPTWDDLVDACAAARERGAYVHVDGARIWETTPHFTRDLPTIAALADSIYVSFYKSLGGLSGAALAGDGEFIGRAKAWRHRYGGQMFTQWPAVLSALNGLDRELPRLPEYVAQAKVVAAALATLPGVTVHPHPPHTQQFQLWLPYPAAAANDAVLALAEELAVVFVAGWRPQPPGDRCMAEVSIGADALDWSAEDVVEIGTAFLDRIRT
jgi:threonine aldolase